MTDVAQTAVIIEKRKAACAIVKDLSVQPRGRLLISGVLSLPSAEMPCACARSSKLSWAKESNAAPAPAMKADYPRFKGEQHRQRIGKSIDTDQLQVYIRFMTIKV